MYIGGLHGSQKKNILNRFNSLESKWPEDESRSENKVWHETEMRTSLRMIAEKV